jgi:KH domain
MKELYDWLKKCNRDISQLRNEISLHQTAQRLGCAVTDLIACQVPCPADKLGQFIGKHGAKVKELQEQQHVTVNIARTTTTGSAAALQKTTSSSSSKNNSHSVIRILGPSLEALAAVEKDLDKVIATTQELHDVSPDLLAYLSAKGIAALTELRERHPDVIIDVVRPPRGSNSSNSNSNSSTTTATTSSPLPSQVRLCGLSEDIERVKLDLATIQVTSQVLQMTLTESSIVVGKLGATINKLVEMHQAAIDVGAAARKGGDNNDATKEMEQEQQTDESSSSDIVSVTVAGPVSNVQMAVQEIEHLLSNHREETRHVNLDKNIKELLKINKGQGIQAMFKKVNEACRQITSPCLVNLSFGDNKNTNELLVKGKAMVMDRAMEMIQEEIRSLESTMVRIAVDPILLPFMIGKGGAGVKELTQGTSTVNIEFETAGQVVVCGLDEDEIKVVVAAVRKNIEDNHIATICHDDVEQDVFALQFRSMMRSKIGKQVSDLVFVKAIEDKKQIVMRGSEENVVKSGELVKQYMAENKLDELTVTNDDIASLLRGGKQSQIVQFADEFGVNLSIDRDRSVVVARGEQEKIVSAMAAVQKYLHGGDGVSVVKVQLDDQSMGVVIGRGGKTKTDLEAKFEGVSIAMQPVSHLIILRGPEKEVEDCRVEIIKLVATARVTERISMTPEQHEKLGKTSAARTVMRMASVQVTVTETEVVVQGSRSNVEYAIGLLNEKILGTYKCRLPLDIHFDKIQEACRRDPAHFARIEKSTSVDMKLDETTRSIVFTAPSHNKVKVAKTEAVKLLGFLLPSSIFECVELPVIAVPKIIHASSLAEVAAATGAETVTLDRDIHTVIVSSTNEKNVSAAVDMIKSKIAGTHDLVSVIQLDPSDDWLVSAIIGKNGGHIRSLRKQTQCNIEVDSNAAKFTISADDAERVAEARAVLEKAIEKERSQCALVELKSNSDVAAFMGRKGAHIKEFQKTHGVDIQTDRDKNSTLRISGKAEAVVAAKTAIDEWTAAREEARQKNETEPAERVAAVRAAEGAKKSVEEEAEAAASRPEKREVLKEKAANRTAGALPKTEEVTAKPQHRPTPPPADLGAASFPALPPKTPERNDNDADSTDKASTDGVSTSSPTTTIIKATSAWSTVVRLGNKATTNDVPATKTAAALGGTPKASGIEAMKEVTVGETDATSVVSNGASNDGHDGYDFEDSEDPDDVKALKALEEQVRSEVEQCTVPTNVTN